MKDKKFLQWLKARLINEHGENPVVDYLWKLESIIQATPENRETPNTAMGNKIVMRGDLIEIEKATAPVEPSSKLMALKKSELLKQIGHWYRQTEEERQNVKRLEHQLKVFQREIHAISLAVDLLRKAGALVDGDDFDSLVNYTETLLRCKESRGGGS